MDIATTLDEAKQWIESAGLTRLTWWQFTWTTGLGILPLTSLMVVMGDNIESLGWEIWLLLLAGGIVLWLAVRRRLQART